MKICCLTDGKFCIENVGYFALGASKHFTNLGKRINDDIIKGCEKDIHELLQLKTGA